eukprot:s748_g13.t1
MECLGGFLGQHSCTTNVLLFGNLCWRFAGLPVRPFCQILLCPEGHSDQAPTLADLRSGSQWAVTSLFRRYSNNVTQDIEVGSYGTYQRVSSLFQVCFFTHRVRLKGP